MALHRHAGGLQIQPLQERAPAGGQDHGTAVQLLAALGGHAQIAGFAADRRQTVGKMDLDALGLHLLLHGSREFPVKAAQQVVAAHQLGHGHAQSMEDAGKFTGDEAGAHDHHLAGQLPLQKQVIAHPAQLGAGDGGPLRPAAHGDQDPLADQLLSGAPWLGSPWGRPFGSAAQPTGDLNRMGIDKPSPAADQGHPRLGEQVPV